MRPLSPMSASDLVRFAQHGANPSCSRGNCGLLRSLIGKTLAQMAKPERNAIFHALKQLARGLFLDPKQRLGEIKVGASHEAEGQACRGFSRNGCKVSHFAFLFERAPQTEQIVCAGILLEICCPPQSSLGWILKGPHDKAIADQFHDEARI